MRGSASMLFGRGSTGGVVNQVSKQPLLADVNEVQTTVGTRRLLARDRRLQHADSATSALRLERDDDQRRQRRQHDRQARHRADLPLGHRHGRRVLARLLLPQQRQRHQLRPALAAPDLERADVGDQPGQPGQDRPEELLRRRERLQRRLRRLRHGPVHAPLRRRRRARTRSCATAATTATSAPRRSASAPAATTTPTPTARSTRRRRRR